MSSINEINKLTDTCKSKWRPQMLYISDAISTKNAILFNLFKHSRGQINRSLCYRRVQTTSLELAYVARCAGSSAGFYARIESVEIGGRLFKFLGNINGQLLFPNSSSNFSLKFQLSTPIPIFHFNPNFPLQTFNSHSPTTTLQTLQQQLNNNSPITQH